MTALQNLKIKWFSRARNAEQQISAMQASLAYDMLLTQKLTEFEDCSKLCRKLENAQQQRKLQLIALAGIREEIRSVIEQIPDSETRCIFLRKYLAYETNEQIAEAMYYDVRTIQRKHKKALEKINIPSEPSISETTIFHNITCEI
ncbi:MAG: hypothetical protein E7496_09025 [Ruminococcus sp.]|nr:hypothetical protein [Ruminococcus sp.]